MLTGAEIGVWHLKGEEGRPYIFSRERVERDGCVILDSLAAAFMHFKSGRTELAAVAAADAESLLRPSEEEEPWR